MPEKLPSRLRKLLLWTTLVAVSVGMVSGLGIDPALGAHLGGAAAPRRLRRIPVWPG